MTEEREERQEVSESESREEDNMKRTSFGGSWFERERREGQVERGIKLERGRRLTSGG